MVAALTRPKAGAGLALRRCSHTRRQGFSVDIAGQTSCSDDPSPTAARRHTTHWNQLYHPVAYVAGVNCPGRRSVLSRGPEVSTQRGKLGA